MMKPRFIPFGGEKPKAASLPEGGLVMFPKVYQSGQVFVATDGSKMKILERTDSGRHLIFLDDKKAGIVEANPEKKYTDQALQDLIIAHGFILSSHEVQDMPVSEGVSAIPASNIVSLEDAREKIGQLLVAPERVEEDKAISEAESMLADMEAAKEGVMKKLNKAMQDVQAVSDLIEDEELVKLEDDIVRITQEVTVVYDQFLAAEEERKNNIPDESYLRNQGRLLVDARAFDLEAQMLLDQVQQALESLESQNETIVAGFGVSAENIHSTSNVGAGDGTNPHEQPNSKGGDDGDGTESPVEVILRDIRQHVMEIISRIDTIEEYQKFRDGMATVPARDDRPERRVFINIGDVRERLGRRLEDKEVQWVNNLENDIATVARKKKNDIAKREFSTFSESVKGKFAVAAYEETVKGEWEMLNEDLDRTAFGKDWDTEQRIDFWKKELYPEVEWAVLQDMQTGYGLDRARSELIFGVLLRRMTASWQYHQEKDANIRDKKNNTRI